MRSSACGSASYGSLTTGRRSIAGVSPFRGWMRWRHVIGLFACLVVLGWLLSGWASMDDGRIFPTGTPTPGEVDGLRGMPFSGVVQTVTAADLRAAGTAGETLEAIGGGRSSRSGRPNRCRRTFSRSGRIPRCLPTRRFSQLRSALAAVWPGRVRGQVPRDQYDALYRLAEYMPTSAVGYRLSAPGAWQTYIDEESGTFHHPAGSRTTRLRLAFFRPAYFEFSGPSRSSAPAAGIAMLLLAVGTAFCATGVVLSVKRLKRSFS